MKINVRLKYWILNMFAGGRRRFFSEGYKLLYPECGSSGLTPWQHYVLVGKRKGYDDGNHPPCEKFFPEGYLQNYPDVKEAGFDPWQHYVLHGKSEGRNNGTAGLDFSPEVYLQKYPDVKEAGVDPWRHYVLHGISEGRVSCLSCKSVFQNVQNSLSGSFSSIDVRVDNSRPVTVNILVPKIKKHASAGPLSILYFGRFLVLNNYHVRFLINSEGNPRVLKGILKYQDAEISKVSDKFEVESFPLLKHPKLSVNSQDMSVATLFNTAFAASEIQSKCRNKKFIYFIQDDEREFFPASSLRCAAEQSYSYDCYPIFSTSILAEHFLNEDVGQMRSKHAEVISQGCPANYYLPPFEKFAQRNKKKFVFYARPKNPRNCYDFAMFLLMESINAGLFDDSWEFYGVGFPKICDIELPRGKILHMLANMPLDKYKESLSTFDIALSLMSTPHPSMPPVDFSLSGCVVVTNTYKNKTEECLKGISKNIICAPLRLRPMMKAMEEAVRLSDNIEQRYENARNAAWPKSWDTAFTEEHVSWLRNIMGQNGN